MVDDSLPTSSPSAPRPKLQRTSASVRGRSSPTPASNGDPPGDGRPPTKRARKAINCEPCRNSKLKCDRSVGSLHIPACSYSPVFQKSPMFVMRPSRSVLCLIYALSIVLYLCSLGTSAMCYQDARGQDGNDAYSRGDDFQYVLHRCRTTPTSNHVLTNRPLFYPQLYPHRPCPRNRSLATFDFSSRSLYLSTSPQ